MFWWGKKESVFAIPSGSAQHSPIGHNLQSSAFAAGVTSPNFYEKHLEPVNSYSVRI